MYDRNAWPTCPTLPIQDLMHGGGGALPYLKMVGNIRVIDSCPFTFANPVGSLFYIHKLYIIDPLFQTK